MKEKEKIVMSIAGSDSSSGAGIQADLKAFTFLGLHGLTVITCITAQSTLGVKTIHKLPLSVIEDQIDTLIEDMKPIIVKTGMLYDEKIVKSVTKKIRLNKFTTVVDPVMASTSGYDLADKSFFDVVKKELIPNAYVLTPNIQEAEILTGREITNLSDIKKACRELYELGTKNVLITGGHLKGEISQDTLFDGEKYQIFKLPKIPDKKAHGSGCTLSALITGHLALKEGVATAVEKSKRIVWNMIKESYNPGRGIDVINYINSKIWENEIPIYLYNKTYFEVWTGLKNSVDKLLLFLSKEYVPEIGINFGYALPNAHDAIEICAIEGRITKTVSRPIRCGALRFGASKHISSIILTVMNSNPSIRSAVNIRYSKANIDKLKKSGLKIEYFDRKKEPKNARSTMEWGTNHVIKKCGFVPDAIYDTGAVGKEPIIRILGENPEKVVKKVFLLCKNR